jgi:hypothetical protein
MSIVTFFLWSAFFHVGYVLSLDCEYSSREYQVVLRPEIVAASFKTGVTQVLDELSKIEKAKEIDFKVSLSSLKYKNVSVSEYVSAEIRDATDFNVPLRFKSRRKKATEPADIVMKTSNADPELACLPLKVSVFPIRVERMISLLLFRSLQIMQIKYRQNSSLMSTLKTVEFYQKLLTVLLSIFQSNLIKHPPSIFPNILPMLLPN